MSVRCLWIFRVNKSDKLTNTIDLKFSKNFPTVERKLKNGQKDGYQNLPCAIELCLAIAEELQLLRSDNLRTMLDYCAQISAEFAKELDSCTLVKRLPFFQILNKTLTVVVIQKFGMVFAVLPDCVIDLEKIESSPDLLTLAMSYVLIHNVAELMPPTGELGNDGLLQLQQYLMVAIPFGTTSELSIPTVKGILAGKDTMPPPKYKLPAWKPNNAGTRTKSALQLIVKEQIRSLEFNNEDHVDATEVFGTIHCKADVDGAPEINLIIIIPSNSGILDQIVYHPCVQITDNGLISSDENESGLISKQIQFRPCNDTFPLCHYRATLRDPSLHPVSAYFKLKEEPNSSVKVLLQLHFNKDVKNNLEICDLQLPFSNRGEILKVDYHPKSSNVMISQDKTTLLWDIAPKSIPKSSEMTLEAQVIFGNNSSGVLKDQNNSGTDSFVKLTYKLKDFTMTGLKVDTKATHFYPQMKVNTTSSSELSSYDIKVWNGNADVSHLLKGPLHF